MQARFLVLEAGVVARQVNIRFFSEQPKRLNKFHAFQFLNETEHVAALGAAETVPDAVFAVNHKRRRLFVVKRAERLVVFAGRPKRDVFADDLNQVEPLLDLFNRTASHINREGLSPLTAIVWENFGLSKEHPAWPSFVILLGL